jgi:hypothetical protein
MELDQLSDEELVATVKRLASQEREATAALVRSLMEVDARRLHLRFGCPSLYAWCTDVIGLAEGAAYHRIEVARAARRVPGLADALDDGSLTLSSARVLAPHVTPENWTEVIDQARHKSRREVERLVAGLHPQQEQGWAFAHVSPGRVRLHVTISEATCDKLRRAQELLRHASPNGDPDTSSGAGSPRPTRLARRARWPPDPGTSRRPSGAQSSHVMAVSARSSGCTAGAPRAAWKRQPAVAHRADATQRLSADISPRRERDILVPSSSSQRRSTLPAAASGPVQRATGCPFHTNCVRLLTCTPRRLTLTRIVFGFPSRSSSRPSTPRT